MKKLNIKLLSIIAAGVLTVGCCVDAFASQAVVTGASIRIRSDASTSGTVVASGKNGQSYEIQETVSGADGYTWYKVKVDDNTIGYVRGDLVKVEGDDGTTTTITTDNTENTATSLAATEADTMTPKTAVINGNAAVNIRSGAGTGYAKVIALEAGTEIVVIGEATDESGKSWYQLTCEAQNVEGYIRADLVTITGEVESEETAGDGELPNDEYVEGEFEDAPAVEEVPENNDYEIVYTTDDEGNYQYYLYDHVTNTRQKVQDLLSAVTNLNTSLEEANSSLATFKILTIVFAALALIFLILFIIFLIKSRSEGEEYYFEDDDDEDDDDEDDEDDDDDDDDEDDGQKASPRVRTQRSSASRVSERESRTRSLKSETTQTTRRPRKPTNFLADDDEFEFEFLNMNDNKD